jgi:hypothetical protein
LFERSISAADTLPEESCCDRRMIRLLQLPRLSTHDPSNATA